MRLYHKAVFKTALGWIGIAVSPTGVRQVIPPQKQRAQAERKLGIHRPMAAAYSGSALKVIENHLVQAKAQLAAYSEGRRRIFNLPLDLDQGSDFQRRVWMEAMQIPYGQKSTYLKIAASLGNRSLARAVGLALGANPLPLIIPCQACDGKTFPR